MPPHNINKEILERVMRLEVATVFLTNAIRMLGGNNVILEQVEKILTENASKHSNPKQQIEEK